jgi:DNA-binding Xre family transcriptional regulator
MLLSPPPDSAPTTLVLVWADECDRSTLDTIQKLAKALEIKVSNLFITYGIDEASED